VTQERHVLTSHSPIASTAALNGGIAFSSACVRTRFSRLTRAFIVSCKKSTRRALRHTSTAVSQQHHPLLTRAPYLHQFQRSQSDWQFLIKQIAIKQSTSRERLRSFADECRLLVANTVASRLQLQPELRFSFTRCASVYHLCDTPRLHCLW
jgi:hypothetical protein